MTTRIVHLVHDAGIGAARRRRHLRAAHRRAHAWLGSLARGPGAAPPTRRGDRAMTLAPGDLLPDIALTDTAGRTVPLSALRGEETLVIFLRHLA